MEDPAGPPPMTTTSTGGEGVKTPPVYSIRMASGDTDPRGRLMPRRKHIEQRPV